MQTIFMVYGLQWITEDYIANLERTLKEDRGVK